MSSENAWVLERIKLYELMQAHPDWSLRHYGHELGHDLKWVRRWIPRIRSATTLTLDTFRSRARAPHHPPKRVPEEAKDLISDLRRELSGSFADRQEPRPSSLGLSAWKRVHRAHFRFRKR